MNNLLKKSLQILSLGTLGLTSCIQVDYGMPVEYDSMKTVKTSTEENEAIKGLKVNLIYDSDTITEYTNNKGIASFNKEFSSENYYPIIVSDVDGEDNLGNFIKKESEIAPYNDTTFVKMKK